MDYRISQTLKNQIKLLGLGGVYLHGYFRIWVFCWMFSESSKVYCLCSITFHNFLVYTYYISVENIFKIMVRGEKNCLRSDGIKVFLRGSHFFMIKKWSEPHVKKYKSEIFFPVFWYLKMTPFAFFLSLRSFTCLTKWL